jgi:hypothetical protein
MDGPENCEQQFNRCINFFLANARCTKGKSSELSTITLGYDIVCLTETHTDHTVNNLNIIESTKFDFFRRDRNIHGGGVLIATNKSFQATEINLDVQDE